MKVLYDDQIFDSQKVGGISRYFFELISSFEKDKLVEWELPIIYSNNEYLKQLPYYQNKLLPKVAFPDYYKNFLWGKNFKGKKFLYKIKTKIIPEPISNKDSEINRANSIQKIKEGNYDIFHPTYYDNYFLDYIGNKPYVLTVHDLIHQIFPEYGLYETKDKNQKMLDRANKIITVSESTKTDLINIFDISEDKVEVIYLANSMQQTLDDVSDEFKNKMPKKYFLYIGSREGYKNFLFFIQMFSSLSAELKDISVVCTGSSFNADEKYFFDKLKINHKIINAHVNDSELIFLYKNAVALVFPSMYEGFGLPVLEAFSCGCPVLVSSSSSLAEIGGDAVIYFEPKNPISILRALKSIIINNDLKENLVNKGYKQLAKFSWNKTSNETKKLYKDVLLHNQ